MHPDDAPLTVRWMVEEYGFTTDEVEDWVQHLHFNWPMSVKAIDDEGRVCGLLNMSDYRIEEETEQILIDAPDRLAQLNALRYIAVFSFIVDPLWRGTRLNYDMFASVLPDLEAHYDFVFIPVLHRLRTHQYWQRWGAHEFYRDADCVYYLLPLAHRFEATVEQSEGMDAAYVRVPFDLRLLYGTGRLAVDATFDGVPYRGSVVNMGLTHADGSVCYVLGMPKAVRRQVGKDFGSTVHVELRRRS